MGRHEDNASQPTETSPRTAVERLSPGTDDYTEILYHWQRYLIAGQLTRGKHALDVACGEGYGADYLARFAERVCAVDVAAPTLKQAQAKYRRTGLHFLQGSADHLPFAAKAFDIATSFETIEHLPPEKQEPFLGEVVRVLKPGGLLLISTPNKRRTETFAERNPYHLKELYLEEFTGLLRTYFKYVDCWFQEINLATFSWKPNGQFPRRSPWNTIGWRNGVYQPSDGAIDDFLYVIAVCSDELSNTSRDLHSVCFDVTRTPLESLWHDYLTQIDGFKRAAEETQNELRTARSSIQHLQGELGTARSSIQHLQGELGTARSSIQDLEAHVKRLETALAVSRFESRTFNRSIAEKEGMIGSLTNELAGIRSSRSWKLVEGYQYIMDRSPLGRILRPIRNRIFKRSQPS